MNTMLTANQQASVVPGDLRYRNLLDALHGVSDEATRDRCYRHWMSMYQYLQRSVTGQHTLAVEEKRLREALHRLNVEMTSRRLSSAGQVRSMLQRGHQVLADLHDDYDKTSQSLTVMKENIEILQADTVKGRTESSIDIIVNSNRSPTSILSLTQTINHFKKQIQDLYQTRTPRKSYA
jgi:regulator of replication initiation timing